MSRIDSLEARRQALLNKCEEQRLELSYRVAQITPRNALTAWSRSSAQGWRDHEPAALDGGRRRTVDDVDAPTATEVTRRRCRPRCRIDYDGVGAGDAGNDGFADIGAATRAVYDLQGDAPTRGRAAVGVMLGPARGAQTSLMIGRHWRRGARIPVSSWAAQLPRIRLRIEPRCASAPWNRIRGSAALASRRVNSMLALAPRWRLAERCRRRSRVHTQGPMSS